MFQSPIGTQKTMDLLLQERSKIPVSIPYRYTKNVYSSFYDAYLKRVSIPYRYTKNRKLIFFFKEVVMSFNPL